MRPGADHDKLDQKGSTMISQIILLLAGGEPGLSPRVWGYLDPGSGSMLFQILIAGMLSSLFCARSAYLRLRSAMFRNHGRA